MLDWQDIEEMAREDFERFTNGSIDPVPQYYKKKQIHWATRMTICTFADKQTVMKEEIEDFIHGLNHMFYFGMGAGMSLMLNMEEGK